MKTLFHWWSTRGCCSIATHRILIINAGVVGSRLYASPGHRRSTRKRCSSSSLEPFRTLPAPVDGETQKHRNVSQVREDQHLGSAIYVFVAVLFSSTFKSFTSRLWRTVANDPPIPARDETVFAALDIFYCVFVLYFLLCITSSNNLLS